MPCNLMLFNHYSIKYVLNLRNIKASRHDLFQNNSTTELNYTLMSVREVRLRKLQETELTNNKDHCQASRQHLAGRMWPAGSLLNRTVLD
jgi:hypothetical protein